MMMPHSIRDQRDAHFVHPPFPQLLYNSMPTPPLYDQSPLHLASQQFQQRQGPMFSSRPLFRTYSTSSPVPTQHSVQENLLRRKTPSGTLPAAYDAAPIEFVPRPNKQILLPCEETPLHIETGVHCWSNGAVYQVPGMGMGNGDGSGFSTEWPSMPKASLDNNLDPYARHFIQQQQNQHMAPPPFQESLWPNCQPTGFQSMYNPITQPTASYDEIAPAAASNHYYTTDVDRRKRSRSSKQESTTYPYIGTTSSHLNPGYAFPIPDANAGNIGMDMFGNESANYPMDSYTDTNLNGWHSAGIPTRNSLNIPNMEPFPNVSSAHLDPARALSTLSALEKLCGESNWTWLDGILLGGRLSYGLGDLNRASVWFRRVLDLDNGHVEALSSYAGVLLSLNRKHDAERYWRQAIKKRPDHLETVEQLVSLLCMDQRAQEAVDIITYVEKALRSPTVFGHVKVEPEYALSGKRWSIAKARGTTMADSFAIPRSQNGRLIALIHAKGNMLYQLGDDIGAAKSFEEAILVAVGSRPREGGIKSLIDRILIVLKAATDQVNVSELSSHPPQTPILLPPEKALQTARLVFPPNGELPGLRDIMPSGPEFKAAVSTTSNSLLSLAKIFQDGMSSGRIGASVRDILALYYLSLSLHASPSTANNVGILLASIQYGSSGGPSSQSQVPGTGVSLALAFYRFGLDLDNRHAHLYTNLGSLLKDINQLPNAIHMYERAVSCDPSFDIALANLANTVKDQGRINDAIKYYRRAVKANPDFAEALCGLANSLNSVCDWKGRGGIVKEGGYRDRWHVDDAGTLIDATSVGTVSSGWMKRVVDIVERQLLQGESWGRQALEGNTLNTFLREIEHAETGISGTTARSQMLRSTVEAWATQPLQGAKIIRFIERASRRAVWRWYQDKYVNGINKPLSEYRRPTVPPTLTTPSAPTVLPFHTFTYPLSAKQVRQISERNGTRISCSTLRSAWLPQHVYPPPAPPAPFLKVGYVSSDFNNHPLAHLMQSVFGLHDQSRVKAYCYATTASDRSEHRKQIETESPVFHDAHTWGADHLAQQIADDGIHILINLNGFTRGARNEVFAARPAPIQMSFMGFAGTLGAEWCDYLYADTTAVPPDMLRKHRGNVDIDDCIAAETNDQNWVYAENIIFSRYTFFCCDHKQSAPDSKAPRLAWNDEVKCRWKLRKSLFPELRDDQVILGNFNQLYKVEPTTFRAWLRILAAVPHAVLWLLRFPDLGETHLRALASSWASEEVASRILFTNVAPKLQHIARAQVCDLFLDTPECNAHTTAADVLWSGTPLLTLSRHRHKMCSRIAASIVRAAVPQTVEGVGVAERLVVGSEEEYESRAVELAGGLRYVDGVGEGELAGVRRVLWEGRWKSELFNTERWVRDLEDAYEEAWRRWVRGEGGDIDLKTIAVGRSTL